MQRISLFLAGATALLASFSAVSAQIAGNVSYFVGVDNLTTLTSGTYAGLANPNAGRLTFLYAHWEANPTSNHYHAKGTLVYTGGVGSPTIVNQTSNFVPEAPIAPLPLVPGTGLYAGKLVTAIGTDTGAATYEFSNLNIRSTSVLAGFEASTPEGIMFNSSSGRWTGALTGADVHLELVSVTPGLTVGSAATLDIFAEESEVHLGEPVNFTPVLWTAADALPGVYVAQFRLHDEANLFGSSGIFEIRTEVIPEPGLLSLLALGGLAAVWFFRRRRAAH